MISWAHVGHMTMCRHLDHLTPVRLRWLPFLTTLQWSMQGWITRWLGEHTRSPPTELPHCHVIFWFLISRDCYNLPSSSDAHDYCMSLRASFCFMRIRMGIHWFMSYRSCAMARPSLCAWKAFPKHRRQWTQTAHPSPAAVHVLHVLLQSIHGDFEENALETGWWKIQDLIPQHDVDLHLKKFERITLFFVRESANMAASRICSPFSGQRLTHHAIWKSMSPRLSEVCNPWRGNWAGSSAGLGMLEGICILTCVVAIWYTWGLLKWSSWCAWATTNAWAQLMISTQCGWLGWICDGILRMTLWAWAHFDISCVHAASVSKTKQCPACMRPAFMRPACILHGTFHSQFYPNISCPLSP